MYDLTGEDTPVSTLEGHEMSVSVVSYRNGKISSGGRDCTTRVWDLETSKTLT